MIDDIISVYNYFLFGDCNFIDATIATSFVKKYSINKGKFFCWHNWCQFEMLPATWSIFFHGTLARCNKCGKIAYSRLAKKDKRLTPARIIKV